ncbi:MAG: ATP-binding protein [Verrucomicrobiota bacterium]|nr:ATP-binding protein [Verrucomicrobiota bacterium]
MTIRTRLSLWYAGILFASVLLVAGFSYQHLLEERRQAKAEHETVEEEEEAWRKLGKIGLWCGIPAALLGLGGGWFLTRKALAPVAALTQSVQNLHEKNLHERLPRTGNADELDRLTEVFNDMTSRLDNSFQRIREFTLHASHELKTPLTVMHGETETALREESLPTAQRERLLSQLDEIQRLTKIVDGLTLLTKADAGQIKLNREAVSLEELVRDSFEDAKILAQSLGLDVKLVACEKISVMGDRHRLRQLFLNLTDNAIKYNQPDGSVIMELRQRENFAELKISNTGQTIPPELQTRLFDRFFRGDQSHNNAVDGSGLGLSIAQWIVTAHGGTIQVSSSPENLTVLTVRLPCRGG